MTETTPPYMVDTTPAVEGDVPTIEPPEPHGRCLKCSADVPVSALTSADFGRAHVPQKGKLCGPVMTRWFYHFGASWSHGGRSGWLRYGLPLPFPIEDPEQLGMVEAFLGKHLKPVALDPQSGAALVGEQDVSVTVVSFNLLRVE